METSSSSTSARFRFGAIADVQYADVNDAWNFARTNRRRYRGVLTSLHQAVEDWHAQGKSLSFIADLGDIIDQQCEITGDSEEALARVLHIWRPIEVPIVRLMGNHELYNFSRDQCIALIPGIVPFYRSFRPADGWRVILLDSYDLNAIERDEERVEQGIAYLESRNPNDVRSPRGTIDVSVGLEGLRKRFMPTGGAIRQEQLLWLKQELLDARSMSEQVIVLTHVPVLPQAAVAGALLWNYDEVLGAFREVGQGIVALVLAGHFHSGGYGFDSESGTYHVTLPSPLHADEQDPRAHCTVAVWNDYIEILGQGLVPSRQLRLKRRASRNSMSML